jgi:8-oxo-dGTP pyrophosphatase MutT (NUDIX family)
MTKTLTLTREHIDRAMRANSGPVSEIVSNESKPLRRAAILCPIIERHGVLSVILTRRADNLRAHPGQISFPGGKIDANDRSPLDAALREAEEEIGLLSRNVEVSGVLEPYPTGTGFLVTPFVGFVDPRFRPVADPGEVAEVFEAPLDFLMDRQNHERESYTRDGETRHFYVIMVGQYRIWGATAGMLRVLADRVAGLNRYDTSESVA